MRVFALNRIGSLSVACRSIAVAFALFVLSAASASAAITVNPATLAAGTLGQVYDNTLTASGGSGPYTFAVTTGALPPGLTLTGASGQLSGTPSAQGVYNFTITATDSLAASGSRAYTMSVGTFSLAVQPNTLPNSTLGAAYNQTLTAVGGNPPYTFAVSSGALPTGVSLATDGTISGATTAGGSFTFIIQADDAMGNTGYRTYTVNVGTNSLIIAPPTLPNGTQGTAYNQSVTASGGTGTPYTYSVSSGALPSGLSLNTSTGQISGTPSAGGSFSFTIRAVDSGNNFGTQSYTINIGGNSLILNPTTLPNGVLASAYSQTVTATGGTGGPYTYSVSIGSLPSGLSLNGSTGAITGTPNTAGSFGFTIHAVDVSNNFGDRNYTISIGTNSLTVNPATISDGAVGVAYSQTVNANGGTAPYTFAISSGALPTGLSLDANSGAITGTPSIAGAFTFTIQATDANSNTGSRSYTVSVDPAPLTVNPSSLPNGSQGVAYSQTVTASGGTAPYTYAVLSGALPTGLSLNTSNGAITGTPTVAGAFNFTISATDANSITGSQAYTVNIAAASLTVNPSTLPNGMQSVAYNQTVTASGGTAPYTYAVLSGTLPTGLSLNAATGAITGTPSAGGNYSFTIQATDANSNVGSNAYTVTIGTTTLTVNPSSLPNGTQGTAYNQSVTASGGAAPYVYALLSGALPTGLSLDTATGAITGTPSAGGSYSFSIQATDASSNTGSSAYTVSIGTSTLSLNPANLPNGTQGAAYSQTITASGGTAPYTYAILSGTLPIGLSLNAATGAITGTPSTSASYSFTIQATDTNGNIGNGAYTVFIGTTALTLNPSSLPNATQGVVYSQTVSASGGTAPYTYTIFSGALPAGLSLDGATGAITGTATGSGISNFTIQVTDANGNVGSNSYTVSTNTNSLSVNPATLPNPSQGMAYSQVVTASGGTAPYTFTLSSGTLPAGLVLNASTGAITGTPTGSGSATFTITATDANGDFGSQSYTFSTAHADPTTDTELRGLIDAQTATVHRFNDAQNTNVQRRIEALHENFKPCGLRLGINASNYSVQTTYPIDPRTGAAFPPEYGDPNVSSAAPVPVAAPPSDDCSLFSGPPVAVWASGAIEFGRQSSGGIDSSKFTTSGLTAGIDAQINSKLIVGAALGYGLDHTDSGLNGTKIEADNFSGMLYASFQPLQSLFIDAVIGHGVFGFDNTRWVDLDSTTVSGERKGSSTFGSTTVSTDLYRGDYKFSPYLQFDAMTATLNAYNETGASDQALTYNAANLSSTAGAIGLRGSVNVQDGDITYTPHMRVEYKRAFDDNFSQSLFYSDTGAGTLYSITQPDTTRDIFSGVVGVRALMGTAASVDVEYGASGDPSSDTSSITQTVRTKVHLNFDGN